MQGLPTGFLALSLMLVGTGSLVTFGGRESLGAHIPEIDRGQEGCVACHTGIEEMHPEAELSCVDCHGGNPAARLKLEAHVAAPGRHGDERVAPEDRNLAWRRFLNPMDLRVARGTCGTCHETEVEHLTASLHATTAGHLSDGYFEMGLLRRRGSRYSVFPTSGAPVPGGEVERLFQVPAYEARLPEDRLATHYTDLARKECMQCHLWSQGRGVRGRVGFDGDYRGEGCAACHVRYARDGLTSSGDRTAARREPGHPERHQMIRNPSTDTCVTCHYGDASIGLHFRGLSQLPPNTPGGPDIPGTTDTQLNRTFYLNDAEICPPDVHHERGMHCIDCHTQNDVMGDGKLHGQMEHAVEISCQACHGTFTERSRLRTDAGTPLEHLRWDGEQVVLTSKVTGKQHVVPQAVHVIDPDRPEHNPEAEWAMSARHAKLECYTCHAGWNANFLGFHFSRNTSLSQLDLLSGKRTPGRVTTQEKVFSTWKSFYAGLNERGAVAPYLTGFSTMGSVWDESGKLVLDQVMPETANGLSGMTMIHHQLHSTRPTARSCVECHRTSTTWGMGSANFRLGRQLAFIADRRGVEVVAINRQELTSSVPLLKIPLPDVVDLVVACDDLQGHARHLYVAEGGRGIHVFDVANPLAPRRVAFVATVNPKDLELSGGELYVADGIGGLRVFDVSTPEEIHLLGVLPTFTANDVEVRWPWAYVADGPGGLVIVDIGAPIAPTFLSAIDLNGSSEVANEATAVETLFQYSRPLARDGVPVDARTRPRNLCALLDQRRGLVLVDVTEPTRPEVLYPEMKEESQSVGARDVAYRGLALISQVDPAEAQGGERTRERDYAYVLIERGSGARQRSSVRLYDVSDPKRVVRGGRDRAVVSAGYATEQLIVADFYNPPFRQRVLFTPGELGVYMADASVSREPVQLGVLPGLDNAFAMAVEEFPLDRMIDEKGARLKDISHESSRWLYRTEIERILGVSAAELWLDQLYPEQDHTIGATTRLHLERLDVDGSGMLVGEEYGPGGGAAVDDDGDQRITMIELARHAGLRGEAARSLRPEPVEAPLLSERTYPDGDLARLLDGTNPFAFDDDGDLRLDRGETERAVFEALDLDGDERLSMDELSRYPGDLRQLRHADELAEQAFAEVDRSGDGWITPREFRLAEREWHALDADQDGGVTLVEGLHDFERERGLVRDGSEWPARRRGFLPLPPDILVEHLLERFDRDADGTLDRDELRARLDLLAGIDGDRNGALDADELRRALDRVRRGGVDACPDDFLGRWDLDGSGTIEEGELPATVWLRLRPYLP